MSSSVTLVSLFNSRKQELIDRLSGLSLPNDGNKIKEIVSNYIGTLFDKDGDFRMTLTQSEDYVLSAALSLLNAQQEIANTIIASQSNARQNTPKTTRSRIVGDEPAKNPFVKPDVNVPVAMVGAGGGALLGHIIAGGWATVFGAIAGTAISIYLSNVAQQSLTRRVVITDPQSVDDQSVEKAEPLNVEQFVDITLKICESVDNLVSTFRAQIRRVVDKYENQEKPSLEKEYAPLLETIQTVVGYERAHSAEDKYAKKISERIEDLAECVENYNLNIVDYSEETESFFSMVPSSKASETKQVYPAIVKSGIVILRGKVFVPELSE